MPYNVTESLFLTADRQRIVPESSSEAAFLFARPGKVVSDADAARYGLTTDTDEKSEDVSENKAETTDENKADEPDDADDVEDADESHVCDECGFEAKSAGGLTRHQKTHE